jgi:spermidine synthase
LKPFRTLGQTTTPDGSNFSLHEHDGEYFLKLNGRQLMSTTATVSELLLAELPCKNLERTPNSRVLIGGLGLGYSLRRALDFTRKDSIVEVAELLPEVVQWNREFLPHINGALLDDKRVKVTIGDVFAVLKSAPAGTYDAVMLDVDNGPTSLVQPGNSRLYDRRGFGIITRALKPDGIVAFWAAEPERFFTEQLRRAGFLPSEIPVKAHERAKRFAHMIYLGRKVTAEELAEASPPPLPPQKRRGFKEERAHQNRRRHH